MPGAIALFRRRDATAEDKRSALVTLAGIFEERRQLIKAELGSADEGALFHIANKFALRHRNGDEQSNYGPSLPGLDLLVVPRNGGTNRPNHQPAGEQERLRLTPVTGRTVAASRKPEMPG
jgi:hypothetical protein